MSTSEYDRKHEKMTYSNYLMKTEEGRWELIDGILYNTTSAPSIKHQRIIRD